MPDWLQTELDRPYHPAAQLFPLLEGAEFDQLKADIAEHGLLEPITLHPDGSILDGRNRHRACLDLEIKPQFETWQDHGSAVAFVISKNIMRRHLTSSQRAAVAVEVLPLLEAEAKERQRKHAGTAPGIAGTLVQLFAQVSGKSRDQAAVLFQTNREYVQVGKSLQEQASDLLEQVKTGDLTMPEAKRELTKRTKVEPPPLAGRYRIFYADPPWKYNDSGVINDDNYGHAERHYPSMTIDELCQLGEQIKAISEPNAVLFLWVTSPMLDDCFRVIQAWGFQYKTSFVWDKMRHNYGHYNSVRHELLLICTRGSCLPDNPTLIDSVQTIEKSDVHSQKPEDFRRIIETLYTHGDKIELFARSEVNGWKAWGNERSR
jgi:N6-adenosine-specific RNA methylase IME4